MAALVGRQPDTDPATGVCTLDDTVPCTALPRRLTNSRAEQHRLAQRTNTSASWPGEHSLLYCLAVDIKRHLEEVADLWERAPHNAHQQLDGAARRAVQGNIVLLRPR